MIKFHPMEVAMEEKDIIDLDKIENTVEPKNESYQREDSEKGFTRNSIEISLLKANKKYDVVSNMLLGNFDENGKYIIPKEILQELISIKKYISQKNNEGTLVKGIYKDGFSFNFLLTTPKENKENGTANSILYIQELISKVNGYIQNTLSTPVGTYVYKYDEFFKQNSWKAFNIFEKDDGQDDKTLKISTKFIDARYNYLNQVAKASQELYKQLEENYFNRRVSILNEIPQGAIVLSEFNKKREKLDKYFIAQNKNKYRFLNELLTSILEADPNTLAKMPAYNILMGSLNNKYLASVLKIGEIIKKDQNVMEAKEQQNSITDKSKGVGYQEIVGKIKGNFNNANPTKTFAPKSNHKENDGGGGGNKKDKKKDNKKDDKKDKKDDKKKVLGVPSKEKKVEGDSTREMPKIAPLKPVLFDVSENSKKGLQKGFIKGVNADQKKVEGRTL